jgi:PAS domain S-box-containing protein
VTIDSDFARFSKTLRQAIVWPVGIIFLTALLLLLYIFILFHFVGWSDHSYRVLAKTRTCQNLIVRSQNDVRGFLLTDDASFVTDYDTTAKSIGPELETLKKLVSDNPDQVIRAEDIEQANNLLADHARTMISHRQQELPTNPDWVKMGRSLLENLNDKFDKFTGMEEQIRDDRLGSVRRLKNVMAYLGGALVLLLAVSVAYLIRKQMMVLAATYRTALKTNEQRHAELIRSETDLEEQKEWLRVTLTSIGDGVIVTDPEGRVVLMNPESERMTGWSLTEALHQPLTTVFRIVNEETRAMAEDPVAKVLIERRVVGLANHTVLLSRLGEECPIEDSAAPICDAQGKILGVVMVFHDATTMRRAQKSLKAYSADLEKQVADRTTTLQQAVSDLEAFSYTVSHDLRSPLRAMQGFSEAVLEDYGEKLDDRGKNYLERIKNAAVRLDRLIQDLLAYTRISRMDVPMEQLDLHRMVHEIVEHYPNLNAPAAEVRIEGTLPKVLGREASLTQILSNLLGNSVRFIEPGKTPEVRVWGEDRGAFVRLWIEDNGVGIAPADQQRIFDMFVQVNDPQAYGGGTGIGLAIVKKAVQTMRGEVGVESEVGTGSKFWVDLRKSV